MSVQIFMVVHPIVIETFDSEPEMLTDGFASRKVRRASKSPWICVPNCMDEFQIHPIVVKIFHSGPK